MRKIRRGDEVEVVSGRNKGQRGKVRITKTGQDRIVIEGVNIVVKHIKRGRARQAGRVEVEAPVHISNVMLICPECSAKTRVGIRKDDESKNERFCKSCEQTIPQPDVD